MIKECFISLYLFFFKGIFNLFKCFPLRDKVTFVVSFGQDSAYIYEEMRRQEIPYETVFLCKKNCKYDFRDFVHTKVVGFETLNIVDMFRSIFHLATSKFVMIDNYFGFLSITNFKEGVECIQLWHAAGALKKFGLKDESTNKRPKTAQQRFVNVYQKFNKIVVGSEAMAKIFMEAFNLSSENILRTGIPRTDLFYDQSRRDELVEELTAHNPDLKNKKVILYAPTYRDGQLNHFEMKLDLDYMYRELKDQYVLLLRFHPAVKNHLNYEKKYPGFVYDYSALTDVNGLLLLTDYLITDYSSIPYEFSILNKPMLFYPYDLEQYRNQKGLWSNYESIVPGPIVKETTEIVEKIKSDSFDIDKIREFTKTWNRYSKGHSSQNLVSYLSSHKEGKVDVRRDETL